MFGSLFDDDAGDFGTVGVSSTSAASGIKAPEAPRNDTGLAGIWNQGATCFLNCTLQVLAYTPELRCKYRLE